MIRLVLIAVSHEIAALRDFIDEASALSYKIASQALSLLRVSRACIVVVDSHLVQVQVPIPLRATQPVFGLLLQVPGSLPTLPLEGPAKGRCKSIIAR